MQGLYQKIKYAVAVGGIGVSIGVVATILGGNLIGDTPDFKYTFERSSPNSYRVIVNGGPYGGNSSLDDLRMSFNEIMKEDNGDNGFIGRIMQKESGLDPNKPISRLEIEVTK